MATVHQIPDVDTSKIDVVVKKNPGGQNAVFINKESGSYGKFRVCLSDFSDPSKMLLAPFGKKLPFSNGDAPPQDNGRYNLAVQINDGDAIVKFFQGVQDTICQKASQQPVDFFGKSISKQNVEFMFHSPLKMASEEEKADNNKSNLLTLKIVPNTRVLVKCGLDENGKLKMRKGTAEDLTPRCTVCPQIDFSSMWFNAGKFGYSAYVHSIIVEPSEESGMNAGNGADELHGFVFAPGTEVVLVDDDTEESGGAKKHTRDTSDPDDTAPKTKKSKSDDDEASPYFM